MSPNFPACYVIIRKNDKFLFVMRENTSFMNGFYSLPAGRVEENEPFINGAIREAQEEVGLNIKPTDLRHVYTQHRFSEKSDTKQWVDVFFEANNWEGEPVNNEPDVHSSIDWLDAKNLPENIMDYQRNALLQIAKGRTYGEFGWPS